MTCVVGYIDHGNKTMYMGADSCGSNHYMHQNRVDPKVFKKGKMLFGFTSSFRMGNLLRFKLNILSRTAKKGQKKKDLYEYMCTDFIDSVIKCLQENNYAKLEHNVVRGGVFLVATEGRLFCIEGDFQVGEVRDHYQSVGLGDGHALGALSAMDFMEETWDYKELSNISAEYKIRTALACAEKHSEGVERPFIIEKLKWR